MKAKRIIKGFTFGDEKHHVALVDQAANLQSVILMKSANKDVVLTLSMKEFLTQFFGMWSDDAETLAKALGYETDTDEYLNSDGSYKTYEEMIQERADKITLLKGVDLEQPIPQVIADKVEELYKSLDGNLTLEESPSEDNLTGDSKLEITKEQLEEFQKSAQAAADLKAQVEELTKSAAASSAQVELLKAAAAAKAEDEMVTLVKGYSFVKEDEQLELAKALVALESKELILKTFESARSAIDAAVKIDGEEGTEALGDAGADLGDTEIDAIQKGNDLVTEMLKSRNS